MTRILTLAFTRQRIKAVLAFITLLLLPLLAPSVFAHGVAEDDKLFIEQSSGMQIIPFIYLGAKHMVTGYDHLLFLFGVIFFLYKMREVAAYVTLFAIGHTLLMPSLASLLCTRRSIILAHSNGYWRNRGDKPVTVKIKVSGFYEKLYRAE